MFICLHNYVVLVRVIIERVVFFVQISQKVNVVILLLNYDSVSSIDEGKPTNIGTYTE